MDDREYTQRDEAKQGAGQRAVETLPREVQTEGVAQEFADLHDQAKVTRGAVYGVARHKGQGIRPHVVGDAIRSVVDAAQHG